MSSSFLWPAGGHSVCTSSVNVCELYSWLRPDNQPDCTLCWVSDNIGDDFGLWFCFFPMLYVCLLLFIHHFFDLFQGWWYWIALLVRSDTITQRWLFWALINCVFSALKWRESSELEFKWIQNFKKLFFLMIRLGVDGLTPLCRHYWVFFYAREGCFCRTLHAELLKSVLCQSLWL